MNTMIPKTRPGQLRRAMRNIHETRIMLYALEAEKAHPQLVYPEQHAALQRTFTVLQGDYRLLTGRTYQP